MDPNDCRSRQVYISDEIKRGRVELPSNFFEESGLPPGHHVVVQKEGKQLKAKSKTNDLLKSTEIGITSHMSELLGLVDGEIVCIDDMTTIGDKMMDEVEDMWDVLDDRRDRAKDYISTEVQPRAHDRVEGAKDFVFRRDDEEPEKKYIEVEPDLSKLGEETEEEEKPQEEVKIWSPDPDGDGKVAIFKPEQDEDEQD